jgi:hypothetical protein
MRPLLLMLALIVASPAAMAQPSPPRAVVAPAAAGKTVKHKVKVKARVPALARPAGTLIYQTKADYRQLVPVLLSADGQQIVAYPAPSDVRGPGNSYPQPQPLSQGYLLDQRGIGPNVGFLKLTYAEYARLTNPPPLAAMQTMLVDRDPLVALCDCGPRSRFAADPRPELNRLISRGQLATRCKKLK